MCSSRVIVSLQAISIYSQPIVREGAVQFRQAVDTVVIPNVKAGEWRAHKPGAYS